MADIDWEVFDALFPPQSEDSLFQAQFSFPLFPAPGIGTENSGGFKESGIGRVDYQM